MNVFLTGASGYVGSAVLERLLAHGHQVTALVHRRPPQARSGVSFVQGDVTDAVSLTRAMTGCEAVVHLVGIIEERPRKGITFERIHVEGTRNMLQAAKSNGIRRYVHMSAIAASPDGPAKYQRTKWAAEEAVRASGLDWTILRPTVVAGPGNEVIRMLAGVLKWAPVFPIFGSGAYEMQPVPIETVAEAFARALELPQTIGRAYSVAGRDRVTYKQMVQAIASVLGRRPLLVHIPEGLIRAVVPVAQHLPGFPITREQLVMLLDSKECDERPFLQDFGLEPEPFRQGLERYVKR